MKTSETARINEDALRGATPKEEQLAQMIESGVLHILVLGQADSALAYDPVLDAARLYRARHGEVRLHILTLPVLADALFALARVYRMEHAIEILMGEDVDALLTDFLGSHLALLMEDDAREAALAQSFYLPVVCLQDKEYASMRGRILDVGSDSPTLAGAFAAIKTGKYEERLTGLRFRGNGEE